MSVDRLAQADPSNSGWQHDLSVSQGKSVACSRRKATFQRPSASYQASRSDRRASCESGPEQRRLAA